MMRRKLAVLFVFILLLTLHSATVCAQQAPYQDSPSSENAQDRGAGYLPYSEPSAFGTAGMVGAVARTIFSLAVVIALLYVFLWGLRKISSGSAGISQSESVKVVGRVYLNPKTVIHFVKVLDELLIVGASSGSIALLATIKEHERIEQVENALRGVRSNPSGAAFTRFFDKSLHLFQKNEEKEDLFEDRLKALDDQIGRLKWLARRGRKHD